jgi:signal transduction histidine kinase
MMAGFSSWARFANFFPLHQEDVRRRYLIGIGLAAGAILLRWLLDPLLGHSAFYVTLYVAVLASALVCGLGPSILTAVLGFGGIVYWFVDLRHLLPISNRDIHSSIACVFVCTALVILGKINRDKQLKLNESHAELERRIAERTSQLADEVQVRRQAEDELRSLSVRLMAVQDEERRRIARDLHDSAGQTLAALRMTIALLSEAARTLPTVAKLADEMDSLSQEALREIRTNSYLLHPPMLDEAGFASAAQWFVDGYSARSGLTVEFNVSDNIGRLPSRVDLALFRVLQEALTNIHRHARCSNVIVGLALESDELVLHIEDNGRGFSKERLQSFRESQPSTSVGLAGMRERLRELGGKLEIESDASGTILQARIPTPCEEQSCAEKTEATSAA